VILAILCDFEEDQPTQVVRQILQNLHKICRKSPRLKKYQQQLLILARLRKMELIVKTEVEAMTIHYDIETDGLYLEGIEKGTQLKEREVILTQWSLQEFSLEKIALLSGSSLEQVITVIMEHLRVEGFSETAATQTLEAYQSKFV
jgi:hypothetical protein